MDTDFEARIEMEFTVSKSKLKSKLKSHFLTFRGSRMLARCSRILWSLHRYLIHLQHCVHLARCPVLEQSSLAATKRLFFYLHVLRESDEALSRNFSY